MLNTRLFYVDSHKRDKGTHSNFSYILPMGLSPLDRVVVLDCMIPKSYYLVQNGSNTFILRENGIETVITIPSGNYNVKTFKTNIAALMTSNSSQGWTYTISFPLNSEVQTGKFTYTVTGNSGLQPSIVLYNNLYEQFGFENNSSNAFIANTLISANVVKFQLEDTLFIHSNIVSSGKDDVLQTIYASTSDFSNISYKLTADPDAYSKPINPSNNNTYNFSLTDEDAMPIDLNGLNMTITLLVYQKDPLSEVLTSAAKVYVSSLR